MSDDSHNVEINKQLSKPNFALDGDEGRKKLVITFEAPSTGVSGVNPFPFLSVVADCATTALDTATEGVKRPDFLAGKSAVRVTLDMNAYEIGEFAGSFASRLTVKASDHPPFESLRAQQKYIDDFDAGLKGFLRASGYSKVATEISQMDAAKAQIG